MTLNVYATLSDNKEVHKNLTLLHSFDNYKIVNYPNSLNNLTIQIPVVDNYNNITYAYVEELNRYMFVTDRKLINGSILVLECHIDVLTLPGVENITGIVSRTKNGGNPYLVDGKLTVLNKRNQSIVNFPADKRFNTNLTYVLTVAGGN